MSRWHNSRVCVWYFQVCKFQFCLLANYLISANSGSCSPKKKKLHPDCSWGETDPLLCLSFSTLVALEHLMDFYAGTPQLYGYSFASTSCSCMEATKTNMDRCVFMCLDFPLEKRSHTWSWRHRNRNSVGSMWVPNLFLLKLIGNGLETKKNMQHIQAGCLQLFILICFPKKDAGKFVSLDSLMLWRQKKPWKCKACLGTESNLVFGRPRWRFCDRDFLDLDGKSKISVMVLVCRLPSDVCQCFPDLQKVIEYINVFAAFEMVFFLLIYFSTKKSGQICPSLFSAAGGAKEKPWKCKACLGTDSNLVFGRPRWRFCDRDFLDLDRKPKISVMVLVCRLPSDVFQYLGSPWNAYALCLDDALEIGKGWVQAAVKGA